MIMKSTVFVTFVVKELVSRRYDIKVVDHQVCSGHAGKLYNEHKLNSEMLCIKYYNTIMNLLEQLYRYRYRCVL